MGNEYLHDVLKAKSMQNLDFGALFLVIDKIFFK